MHARCEVALAEDRLALAKMVADELKPRPSFLFEKRDELGGVPLILVGNIQVDDTVVGWPLFKFLADAFAMLSFHYDNHIRPRYELFGQWTRRILVGASR